LASDWSASVPLAAVSKRKAFAPTVASETLALQSIEQFQLPMRFNLWKAEPASSQTPSPAHFELGRRGEALAIEHLERAGYRIVAANFSLPIGRNLRDVVVNAEIDVVAYDGPTLCFVEVKTRASDDFAAPEVNVDLRKRRQIARAALAYRRMLGLFNEPYRYDVVTLVAKPDGAEPRIKLLKGFWSDAQLKKRKWQQHYWE
jgi:putative endonuclease